MLEHPTTVMSAAVPAAVAASRLRSLRGRCVVFFIAVSFDLTE
ncbi:hypothetical protein [Tsukamurella sp. PLM1]|nr:hypothetical protein [Tsukamurella sp. PLM1]